MDLELCFGCCFGTGNLLFLLEKTAHCRASDLGRSAEGVYECGFWVAGWGLCGCNLLIGASRPCASNPGQAKSPAS